MWWWVLIWALLMLVALVYLAGRVWGVWGQFKDLREEVAHASAVLEQLETQADRLSERAPDPALAVFGDRKALKRERLATRAALREQRHARRAARLPMWARHLD